MIEFLGNAGLLGSVGAAGVAAAWAIRSRPDRPRSCAWVPDLALVAVFLALTTSMVALLVAFLSDQFEIQFVASHSERSLSLGLKSAALWSGQEGSLLLWAWLGSIANAVAVLGFRGWRGRDRDLAVATLATISAILGLIVFLVANPFSTVPAGTPVDEGLGLSPHLRAFAMIIHPPLLFAGYSCIQVPFAAAMGMLIAGRRDNQWIEHSRVWARCAWAFLVAGIIMGAWWAYTQLGWGGYWAWDPVENASLMPLLAVTALLHTMNIHRKRGLFLRWALFLVCLAFLLCLLGTGITRSGVVPSVHAYARSPIGMVFFCWAGGTLVILGFLAIRNRQALRREKHLFRPVSLESAVLISNVLFVSMTGIVLVGTLLPVLARPFCDKLLSVGPSFYNAAVLPLVVTVMFIMAYAPVLKIGGRDTTQGIRTMAGPWILAIAVGLAFVLSRGVMGRADPDGSGIDQGADFWTSAQSAIVVMIMALGAASIIMTLCTTWSESIKTGKGTLVVRLIRPIRAEHGLIGGQVAHLGLVILALGVLGSGLFRTTRVDLLEPGQSVDLGSHQLRLEGVDLRDEGESTLIAARMLLVDSRGRAVQLEPGQRYFKRWPGQPAAKVAIHSTATRDLHVSLGRWEPGSQVVTIATSIGPILVWIWIGGATMVGGSLVSIVPGLLVAGRRSIERAPGDVRDRKNQNGVSIGLAVTE